MRDNINKEFIEKIKKDCPELSTKQLNVIKKHHIMSLKEQDRDTRHACAETVSGMSGDNVIRDRAHNLIMNCRSGLNIGKNTMLRD